MKNCILQKYQNQLSVGNTYQSLFQLSGQNIFLLAWILQQRGCFPDLIQTILSVFFSTRRNYYDNGILASVVIWKDNFQYQEAKIHGLQSFWDDEGSHWWQRNWKDNRADGLYRVWRHGQPFFESDWKDGRQVNPLRMLSS